MNSTFRRFRRNDSRYLPKHNKRCKFNYYIKKHPVSHLYDYCEYWRIKPKFSFIEIRQKAGIEYACLVKVEDYFGEGRSFNKKTSKAMAAADVLKKIMFFDPRELLLETPKRFVSQTFNISVVSDSFTGEVTSPESCSDSGVDNGMEIYEGSTDIEEDIKRKDVDGEDDEELPLQHSTSQSSARMVIYEGNTDIEEDIKREDEDGEDDEELPLQHSTSQSSARFPECIKSACYMQVTESSGKEVNEKNELLEEINNFCDNENESEEEEPEPPSHINDNHDIVLQFESKEIEQVKEYPDPVEYLRDCCIKKNTPLPFYRACITNGKYVSKCNLMQNITYGKGETLTEAKRISASHMIVHMNW